MGGHLPRSSFPPPLPSQRNRAIPQLCLEEEETSGQTAKKKVWTCQLVRVLPKGLKRFPNLSQWWSLPSRLALAKLDLKHVLRRAGAVLAVTRESLRKQQRGRKEQMGERRSETERVTSEQVGMYEGAGRSERGEGAVIRAGLVCMNFAGFAAGGLPSSCRNYLLHAHYICPVGR